MSTYKWVLHASFFIMLLLAPYTAANAELFTYTFTGVIETVDSELASEVSPSQPISGSFTYESTTPGAGDYNGAITEATCKIGTLPAVTTDISQGIYIQNDRIVSVGDLPRDNIVFSPVYFNKLSINGFDLLFCAVELIDFTGTAFENTDLPDPPDRTLNLDDFQVTDVVAIFVLDDPHFPFPPQSAVIRGKLTSLEIDGASPNSAPNADAGTNIIIDSVEQSITTLLGTASDIDADPLTYRWLEDTNVLQDYAPVGTNGEAHLVMDGVPLLVTGEHTLVLEVDDGTTTAISDMILTINNSPPNVAPSGGGTFQLGDNITLSGEVSDFDGDGLNYRWFEGLSDFTTSFISTIADGTPVHLPDFVIIGGLPLGNHVITLEADDDTNSPESDDITVDVIDTTAPTISATVSPGILWPPNHQMVDVVIQATAADNSGSVTLTASVASSESPDTDGDGNTIPDYTTPVINSLTGEITLQLRSERKGQGTGRKYTITVTATDDVGNSSDATVEIVAPHDKGKK